MNARAVWRGTLLASLLLIGGLAILLWRINPMLHAATASVSRSLCSAAFVSGLDPAKVYREEQLPDHGISKLDWALRYSVDRDRKAVRATVLGGFATRAVFRVGYGCHLANGDSPSVLESTSPPPIDPAGAQASPPLNELIDPRLSLALDAAFAEVDARALRQTKAVVVLRDGKLIAERYAPGYGPETPIWVHSLTKSVISALIGILVRDGKLKVDQPAPVSAWQTPGDPRRAVTIGQLLKMDSGLPFDETNEILSLATRLFMLEPDSAAFAARQPLVAAPGQQWGYSNLSYALLSGLIRDAVGGDPGETLAFMRSQLFEPLGMLHSTLEFDATGTPMGAGFLYASARDCARFGQLYLDDGVANGRRILPEGWTQYSARQSLDSTGYGAGFWTNRKTDGEIPYWGADWGLPGLPTDTYFGRGYLGQFIVIVPSARLVVVRLGLSHDTSTGIGKLITSILETLNSSQGNHP